VKLPSFHVLKKRRLVRTSGSLHASIARRWGRSQVLGNLCYQRPMAQLLAWVLLAMAVAWKLTSQLPGTTPKNVAEAIAQASYEKPLFKGMRADEHTASLMVAVARYESGFRQVAGDCKGLKPGDLECGKPGTTPTSFCFMQIHFPDGVDRVKGYTKEELMADPLACARAGREILRASILASPPGEPLRQYAGSARAAEIRFGLAKKLIASVEWTYQCED
jgi:hypothetical protein